MEIDAPHFKILLWRQKQYSSNNIKLKNKLEHVVNIMAEKSLGFTLYKYKN